MKTRVELRSIVRRRATSGSGANATTPRIQRFLLTASQSVAQIARRRAKRVFDPVPNIAQSPASATGSSDVARDELAMIEVSRYRLTCVSDAGDGGEGDSSPQRVRQRRRAARAAAIRKSA